MLSEPSPPLIQSALTRLLSIVDLHWHEIATYLPDLEAMAESGTNATTSDESADATYNQEIRSKAAALASRVFFHLEEPSQALRLALESHGMDLFETSKSNKRGDGPYVDCLIGAAMDAYVKQKKSSHGYGGDNKADADDGEGGELDEEKLSSVVQKLFERCYAEGHYEHALGVALEAMEASRVVEILDRCSGAGGHNSKRFLDVLKYALELATGWVMMAGSSPSLSSSSSSSSGKSFRKEVVRVIAQHLQSIVDDATIGRVIRKASAVSLSRAYQNLNDAEKVAAIVSKLLDGGLGGADGQEDDNSGGLLGLQLCFDLMESGNQTFANNVASNLPTKNLDTGNAEAAPAAEEEMGEGESVKRTDEVWDRYDKAKRILTGGFACELALSFLHKNSNSDRLIMENLKKALEERGVGRNSVLHNCAVMTHSYLNVGTTDDSFLRDHLEWMKKASNWAKFSATASLGVIHAGHITEAMPLLEPYLPSDPSDPSSSVSPTGGYAEGGSLYALGLIHGSHAGSSSDQRKETNTFLRNHLRSSHSNEAISHGASLAVGLTALGTNNLDAVNELKELLYTDSAVVGEGAGMAIGMILVGSGAGNVHHNITDTSDAEEVSLVVNELKNYARETQHEKIIRGIAMGLALMNYGQEENADAVIDEMRDDRDPILRYGAQYALALAYCGTGSNKAVRILLHTAVSDVSDDVRMAAVIALAFVLYKTPDRVPQLVKLLLESFNPHVRYGSCMAVGIAMAGTGDAESIALLEPMLSDMNDFVRQGALLGTAMVYMQQGDSCNRGKKIKAFREKLVTTVSDKHQTTLTKMGAILATGIIDAGGRNCALDLGSKNGFTKMTSAVGTVLWLQHWYWFPMMHMLSLAVTPTFTIGLNKDFKFPKNFEIICNSKPSIFAYPKKLEEKKEEKKKRVETVTLSITAKNKARLARKKAKEEGESGGSMEEEEEDVSSSTGKNESDEGGVESMEIDDGAKVDKTDDTNKGNEKREPEPTTFRLSNPCRITKAQAEVCAFDLNQRYRPIHHDEKPCGVIMLTDSSPGEDEDLGTVKAPSIESEDEADPPEPFEWTPPGHSESIPTPKVSE